MARAGPIGHAQRQQFRQGPVLYGTGPLLCGGRVERLEPGVVAQRERGIHELPKERGPMWYGVKFAVNGALQWTEYRCRLLETRGSVQELSAVPNGTNRCESMHTCPMAEMALMPGPVAVCKRLFAKGCRKFLTPLTERSYRSSSQTSLKMGVLFSRERMAWGLLIGCLAEGFSSSVHCARIVSLRRRRPIRPFCPDLFRCCMSWRWDKNWQRNGSNHRR